jgi:hypothetical protein
MVCGLHYQQASNVDAVFLQADCCVMCAPDTAVLASAPYGLLLLANSRRVMCTDKDKPCALLPSMLCSCKLHAALFPAS